MNKIVFLSLLLTTISASCSDYTPEYEEVCQVNWPKDINPNSIQNRASYSYQQPSRSGFLDNETCYVVLTPQAIKEVNEKLIDMLEQDLTPKSSELFAHATITKKVVSDFVNFKMGKSGAYTKFKHILNEINKNDPILKPFKQSKTLPS